MKPRFEEHDGQLFRMMDKPVPLAPDSKLPCLVQLIQDDSPMGRNNKNRFISYLEQKFIIKELDDGKYVEIEKWFFPAHNSRFEIIGYPVEEGSRWWALYSAMNGKSFVHKDAKQCRIFTMFSERELRVSDGEGETVEYVEIDEFLNDAAKDGWQIYKEPETDKEPIAACDNCKHRCTKSNIDYCQMYEPKPTFKVGDWVKHDVDSYLQVIEPSDKDKTWCRTLSGIMVYPYTSLLTKVSPSEVVIHIGCLKGTVAPVSTNGTHIWFHLIGVDDKTIATIRISCLDTPTRKLVESLLEAMQKEEK